MHSAQWLLSLSIALQVSALIALLASWVVKASHSSSYYPNTIKSEPQTMNIPRLLPADSEFLSNHTLYIWQDKDGKVVREWRRNDGYSAVALNVDPDNPGPTIIATGKIITKDDHPDQSGVYDKGGFYVR